MHNNKTRKALRLKYFKQMLNKIIWYQIVNSLKICTLCRLHAATNVPESCIVHAFFFLSFSLLVNDREKAVQYTLDLRKPDLRKNLDLRKIVGATDFLVHKLFDLRKIF